SPSHFTLPRSDSRSRRRPLFSSSISASSTSSRFDRHLNLRRPSRTRRSSSTMFVRPMSKLYRRARRAARTRPARDLGKDEHFAVGADRLEQRVLVDLAVDGHGHALLEVRRERRMELAELPEELLHGARRELELGDSSRELREVAD